MYITVSDIEKFMQISVDVSAEPFIESLIGYCEKYVENLTGRKFEAPDPDTATTRYFDGNGRSVLPIADLRELTSLTVDDVELTVDEDFFLLPYNAVDEGVPFSSIALARDRTSNANPRAANSSYVFDQNQRSVAVTGKWGYSDVAPDDVKLAMLKMVDGLLRSNSGDAVLKEVTNESIGEYSVTYAKVSEMAERVNSKSLLEFYIRPSDRKAISGTMKVS